MLFSKSLPRLENLHVTRELVNSAQVYLQPDDITGKITTCGHVGLTAEYIHVPKFSEEILWLPRPHPSRSILDIFRVR